MNCFFFCIIFAPLIHSMEARIAKSVHIKGLVQGIGFRPFVYRLAMTNHICGWVENGNSGVSIFAEGLPVDLDNFIAGLSEKAPRASVINEIIVREAILQHFKDFQIKKSEDYSEEITDISPDIAVCDECLADMKMQGHRIGYPFINCTNCGPRFSIIRGLPYDRAKTTMEPFPMCPICEKEYKDVTDRRFHAQPVACNHCGPHYQLIIKETSYTGIENILNQATRLILSGQILAIKGVGGYHLACDATNEEAVKKLRQRKYREGKPFAVMFRDITECGYFMEISKTEAEVLESWRKPIVILKNKNSGKQLASSVSNGFDTTGVMLPYMPFHHLLFESLQIPAIVLTSGNLSDEPVVIDDDEALKSLDAVADAFLVYNREIFNREDDSVMMVTDGQPILVRRSRGFAPAPVNLNLNVDGIFAAGAELVNCFCLGKEKKALMSQHIGDLKNLETLRFYEESLQRYINMFRVKPQFVAADLHPDYLSTRFAEEFAARNGNLPLFRIQHHHAHIASCMAEHGLDEKVIGISMDGVGYGTDGHIWGFEVILCDLLDFERLTHLEYVPQPGGDMANHEPWRMALSYVYQYINQDLEMMDLPFIRSLAPEKLKIIKAA
ncbi:MAG: carbamoyltransferase HypF, partial [Bacteroidales bacterium]|nr:carbamoyltransferase HypF [Bacteroidales bacterium]